MLRFQSRCLVVVLVMAALSSNVYAVDGVILIDQNRALAGNVTPGDTPGFPVSITQPGSYRLSGNLTVPGANTTAILIDADNVTIDLNGFAIIGPVLCVGTPVTSCNTVGDGIGVDGGLRSSITVINGHVNGMGQNGLMLQGTGSHVEKVHARSNAVTGIWVRYGIVRDSIASENGYTGFNVIFSTVSGNTATFNGIDGMFVTCPSSVVGNTVSNNGFRNLTPQGLGCSVSQNATP